MLRGVRAAGSAAVLAVVAALCVVVYGPVPMAQAHAQLIASDPVADAQLAAVPTAVTLTFSDEINGQFVRVAMTTPAGPVAATATTAGQKVSVPVPGRGPGGYRVTYRVVSSDGHPVSGALAFTVTGTPTATASPTASPTDTVSPTASPTASPTTTVSPSASAAAVPDPLGSSGGGGDSSTGLLAAAAVAAAAALVGLRFAVLAFARRREQQR